MLANRSARFSPRIQALVLVALLAVHLLGAWWFVDAVMEPDKVEPWRAYAGAILVSLGAEPWGVLIALALSRKNDT